MKQYKSDRQLEILANMVLAILSIFALFPFLLLVSASFTEESTALTRGFNLIPYKVSLDAYKYILREWIQIGRAYFITVIVTITGTAVGMALTTALAYGLSRNIPGVRFFTFYVVFTMLFNGGIVASYYVYTNIFPLKNTLFALLIPGLLMNGFNIILIKNYFQSDIPPALIESAKIDGASELKVFTSIVIPLSKPILATTGLMSAIRYWNDWTNALYYLDDPKFYSIQALLNKINENAAFLASNSSSMASILKNQASIPTTTARMAIAVIGIAPIILIFPFFQQYFVKGITIGAVKG